MNTLHLTLKKKWYDMILSGEKTEEYREIKLYWIRRLLRNKEEIEFYVFDEIKDTLKNPFKYFSTIDEVMEYFDSEFKNYDQIHFYNGGSPSLKYPNFIIECKGITIDKPNPKWCDNPNDYVFVLKLGKILSK